MRSESSFTVHRTDSAKILSTMVPGLPPPIVNLCLDICFGKGEPCERASPGSGKTRRRSSSKASNTVDEGLRSFVLRRMDSGPLGQHSLTRPAGFSFRRDKQGFCSRPEKLSFDLQLDPAV